MRTLLVACLVTLVGAVPASGNAPLVGSSQYVLRLDQRLCPSPLCGGYWVALANHSRTRCNDGARRPGCYAAIAVDEHRHPLTGALPDGALVRAAIQPWTFEAFGELGALVVADVRAAVGKPIGDVFYRLRDLGIRCIRAPCFSLRASRLNSSSRITVSGVDLIPAKPTSDELKRAEAALTMPNGLFAAGRIVRTPDGGLLFRASQVFLRVAPPRG